MRDRVEYVNKINDNSRILMRNSNISIFESDMESACKENVISGAYEGYLHLLAFLILKCTFQNGLKKAVPMTLVYTF